MALNEVIKLYIRFSRASKGITSDNVRKNLMSNIRELFKSYNNVDNNNIKEKLIKEYRYYYY